ncbi:C40 family peptidase [Paenibacillus sp. MBLB4367]|uniref:C40 family peptidase n=1 Tax=Paenibacillus sp. MBLB4367 TaxID=3384767 RepID=UPI0039083718
MNISIGKTLTAVGLSLTLMLSGTAALGSTSAHAASAVSATSKANSIIATGKGFLGVPYKYGAPSGSTSRFDCSSFTQYIFAKQGIKLPRSSKQQLSVGKYVPRSQLQPGDLVFFYSPVHHVGVYIGNGKIMHTYGKPGVTISNLNSGWWNSHYTTARRVIN